MLLSENHQAQPWHLTSLAGNALHLGDIRNVGGKRVIAYTTESRYLQGCVWHFEDDQQDAGASPVQDLHRINGGDVYQLSMNSANYADLARPSSLHSGGVNVAMADGSVRFVVESIDYRTYQAMMTPAGQQSDVPMNEFVIAGEL